MSNRGFAKTIGVAVVALIVCGVVLYVAMRPTVRAPDEANRVSFAGFSMIGPAGWEARTQLASVDGTSGNTIVIQEVKSEVQPGLLRVAELPAPKSEAELKSKEYEPVDFDGMPAWRKRFTEEKMHGVNYFVIANGRWYELRLRRPLSEPIDASWMAYLKSFRPIATPPTTSPAR